MKEELLAFLTWWEAHTGSPLKPDELEQYVDMYLKTLKDCKDCVYEFYPPSEHPCNECVDKSKYEIKI